MRSRAGLILVLLRAGQDPAQITVKLALRRLLKPCQSVLDVGCGSALTLRQLGLPNTTGIEGYEPAFEEAKRRRTHDHLVLGDVCNLAAYFQPRQFDACVALDVIEHQTKADGLRLMEQMERIAARRVVFFTPNGFLPQGHLVPDDRQTHLSGWEAAEMERYGYRVVGCLGPKKLRGERHHLTRRPALFWAIVSLAGHFLWTHRRPAQAAALLCCKTIAPPPSESRQ
ncbi:MAG TPA: class I SAM-dependent methyltransferase [Dongiaceae bacterium]|nr:class I SAM-dependent methyltransferase [Dongiaceae bacterium]